MLDGTIVGVALPAIIRSLHLSLTDAQWSTVYAVLLRGAAAVHGQLRGPLRGREHVHGGAGGLRRGSLLAALSGRGGLSHRVRAVPALGAAFIMPSAPVHQ
ncbi:hypothetical protein QJS66_13130 [Kocuria rhizophila]|nr:hypothetical protein QJS66_13130 [Kocuria rhizophila]